MARLAGALRLCACAAVLLGAIPTAAAVSPAAAASAAPDASTAAGWTSIAEKSTLHRVKVIGNTLVEEGDVQGTLGGRVEIHLDIEAERDSATSQFVMYLSGGELVGHAVGKATAGKNGWVSFGGDMWLGHGTGRYAHATGSGRMYGALDRRDDVLVVQVTGRAHGV